MDQLIQAVGIGQNPHDPSVFQNGVEFPVHGKDPADIRVQLVLLYQFSAFRQHKKRAPAHAADQERHGASILHHKIRLEQLRIAPVSLHQCCDGQGPLYFSGSQVPAFQCSGILRDKAKATVIFGAQKNDAVICKIQTFFNFGSVPSADWSSAFPACNVHQIEIGIAGILRKGQLFSVRGKGRFSKVTIVALM